MASYDTGYEDELFQHPVGPNSHCGICYNVVKNPVMCRHNEHLFCRACITRYLMNSQTCPSCLEPLTVGTLSQPSQTIMNLLSELKIRCQFFNRGCETFIELGNLDRHVADCGFAPAVCSNEGCRLEVNKQDLLRHETAVCELRRVQCHNCNDIRQEMDVVKVNLAAVKKKLTEVGEKLDRNEKKLDINGKSFETNVKAVKDEVVAKVELVQEQLNKQEESNRQLKEEKVEMKKSLNEITKQLERLTQQTLHEVQAEQEHEKKGIAEAHGMDREPKVVIAGGWNGQESLNSVEMFSFSKATWELLPPMKEPRHATSSVVYNDQIFVIGGYCNGRPIKTMEKLSMNAVEVDQSISWENFCVELPARMWGHCCVVYNERLIMIGGDDVDKRAYSDSIAEISLVPPHTSKVLATMPQTRWFHSVVLFGGKIVILGGRKDFYSPTNLKSVLYDIADNECKELAPLPYPVSNMAAVKWDDDNVILVGGFDSDGKPLNKVLMYNIKTQNNRMLPNMKYKRQGCVAAVVRDTVIVMGGKDERGNYLKSVECFRFDRFTWEELPELKEARYLGTAVVC
ncbi:RING finger 151-like [Paramuricea clavata]|uniref:RING finger 151-like n=1 Tax=Paramuricea clavata TaxID=317549 RepID=A0A7D9M2I9_PARCT|nr:RING finger 151-like [Paramuricea clavata]